MPKLSNDFIYIMFTQLLVFATSIFSVIFLSVNLGEVIFGKLNFFLTIHTFINIVVLATFTNTASRYFSYCNEKNQMEEYKQVNTLFFLVFSGSLFIINIISLFYQKFYMLLEDEFVFTAILFFSLAQGVFFLNVSILNTSFQRKAVFYYTLAECALRIFFLYACIHIWDLKLVSAVIFTYAASNFLSFIVVRCFLPNNHLFGSLIIDDKTVQLIRKMWNFGAPYTITGIPGWCIASMDRWALMHVTDASELGNYALAMQLCFTPITMLIGATSVYLTPLIFSGIGADVTDRKLSTLYSQLLKISLLCFSFFTIYGFVIISIWQGIISKFYGNEFALVSGLIPIVVIAGGVAGIGQILSIGVMATFSTRRIVVPTIAISLVHLGLTYSSAKALGAVGVALAVLVTHSLNIAMYMKILPKKNSQGSKIKR